MANRMILNCPGCGGPLEAVRLSCRGCGIAIEGRFANSPFARLSEEQQEFAKVFLAARGNIKLVEKVMGISYPTVRNRLDAVRQALGLPDLAAGGEEEPELADLLDRVESGEVSVDEAVDSLE